MKWQEFVRDYLSFTRKERIGMLILSGLMLIVFFLPQIIPASLNNKEVLLDTAWLKTVQKLEIKSPDSGEEYERDKEEENINAYQFDRSKSNYFEKKLPKAELFYFDPNTISEAGWKKLGLRDKLIGTIQRYLNKGGHFSRAEDLQRIYGLHPDEYARLAPYIQITSPEKTEEHIRDNAKTENRGFKTNISSSEKIDINTADTSAFISLPGIGSKLAARIVNFRDKLGGFYSAEQIRETYGLPDSTFQKIRQYLQLDNSYIKKININTATVDELKAHPYIKFSLASPIVAYRNEHGPFAKIEDLKKVMVISDEIYKKIIPYITAQ